MSWWGKVVGGTFGFMLGGPLGALLGVALGNYFDSGMAVVAREGLFEAGNTERVQSAFFTATFSIMGYIAKSDGRVTSDEIRLAEQVMDQMHLNPQQRKVAISLFNQGKADDFPVNDVMQQLRQECFRRGNLIQMFLEIIVATAFADGNLDSKEQQLLEGLASKLGYSQLQFKMLLARLAGQNEFMSQESVRDKLHGAYELLGVNESVSEGELKKAYRRQMSQHHPDKLVAKGLPEEMMELATAKTQEIKAAYELIKQHRS